MRDKPLLWLGSSRSDLRAFPPDARRLAGFQLRRVQQGLDPNDWKPIRRSGPAFGRSAFHVDGEYPVFYVAAFKEAVYVLHAFHKVTQKTPIRDFHLGRQRFRDLVAMRQARDAKRHT